MLRDGWPWRDLHGHCWSCLNSPSTGSMIKQATTQRGRRKGREAAIMPLLHRKRLQDPIILFVFLAIFSLRNNSNLLLWVWVWMRGEKGLGRMSTKTWLLYLFYLRYELQTPITYMSRHLTTWGCNPIFWFSSWTMFLLALSWGTLFPCHFC